jgi:hypothetical protein
MYLSLPRSRQESVCLGRAGPLWLFPYTIPLSARHVHLYTIGASGSGKSKFLESLLVGDIRAGRGCSLVDPHTDLARDTLMHLLSVGYFSDITPYERIVYFDPTRGDYAIPFNILKSPGHPYTIAQQVIEAFRRTWPQALEEAPRFTNIALAALLVLIETGQSLVEMPLVLTNKDYREELLSSVRDPDLVGYFHDRFDKWEKEGAVMMESVLNKVTAFTFNPYLKHILGASENRLDFRAMMDEGKVLLVDLGNCDGETRRLLGSLVVTGMELAALSRKDQLTRPSFYFYIDEFPDFCSNDGAAKTLSQILSECRKFGLHMLLAHQTLGQLQDRIISALGNVGVKVVFGVDREDAEVMAKKLFFVDTSQIKHVSATETQMPLYDPVPEQWEKATAAIQTLRPRFAYVKQRGTQPVLVRTETIRPYRVTHTQVEELMKELARKHGEPLANLVKPSVAHRPREPVRIVDWETPSDTLPPNLASYGKRAKTR